MNDTQRKADYAVLAAQVDRLVAMFDAVCEMPGIGGNIVSDFKFAHQWATSPLRPGFYNDRLHGQRATFFSLLAKALRNSAAGELAYKGHNLPVPAAL